MPFFFSLDVPMEKDMNRYSRRELHILMHADGEKVRLRQKKKQCEEKG